MCIRDRDQGAQTGHWTELVLTRSPTAATSRPPGQHGQRPTRGQTEGLERLHGLAAKRPKHPRLFRKGTPDARRYHRNRRW
eukprot:14729710-Alexandrium_andersonii.AAC.1